MTDRLVFELIVFYGAHRCYLYKIKVK